MLQEKTGPEGYSEDMDGRGTDSGGMLSERGNLVLCGANAYEQKYYYNPLFQKVPESIQKELHIICVLFTQHVGGIFTIEFEEDGGIALEALAEEEDITYDAIAAGMLTSKIRRDRQDLFEALSLYFRSLVLKEDIHQLLGQ